MYAVPLAFFSYHIPGILTMCFYQAIQERPWLRLIFDIALRMADSFLSSYIVIKVRNVHAQLAQW